MQNGVSFYRPIYELVKGLGNKEKTDPKGRFEFLAGPLKQFTNRRHPRFVAIWERNKSVFNQILTSLVFILQYMLTKGYIMSKIEKYEYRAKTGELLGWYQQNPQNIKFDPVSGGTLHTSIEACITLSNKKNLPVRLVFNDVKLDINAQSDIQDIKKIYFDKINKRTR